MRKVWSCRGAGGGDEAGGLFRELAGAGKGTGTSEKVGKAAEAASGDLTFVWQGEDSLPIRLRGGR